MVRLPIKGRGDSYQVNPSKIIALGKNYLDHIKESTTMGIGSFDTAVPTEPVLFPKNTSALIGPEEAIVIPAFLLDYRFDRLRTDYEAELAFIIKDRCKNLSPETAIDHVLAYTAFNDVSQRNLQHWDKSGWWRGKSLDTFAPIGPQLVLAEDINNFENLAIQCRLNGKIVQESNTSEMIFKLTEVISFISKNFTLLPGDIISTGTPAGVGPLNDGDLVEVEIEGIGVLKNTVIDKTVS